MKGGSELKHTVCAAVGAAGGLIASLLGGWDGALPALVVLMAVDYLTGLMVAGVFRRSEKSENGALSSKAGFQGLCKKGVMLLMVLVGARLDSLLGLDALRDAVAIGFLANELLSILENAALMGVPVPKALKKALDILQDQADGTGE